MPREHYQINIQWPESERAALEDAARAASLPVSTYLRIVVLQAIRGATLADQLQRGADKAAQLAEDGDDGGKTESIR